MGPKKNNQQYEVTATDEIGAGEVADVEAGQPDRDTMTSMPVERASSGGNQKIKFKKAKKMGKNIGKTYMKTVQDIKHSRKFATWTKRELADLLISQNIELRGESSMDHDVLQELAEALYLGREMPKRPEPVNLVQMTLRHVMARRIQNLWVAYILLKRIEAEKKINEEYIRKVQDMDHTDVDEIGQVELMYMDAHHEIDIKEIEQVQHENHQDDIESGLNTPMAAQSESKQAEVAPAQPKKKLVRLPSKSANTGKKTVNVLDLPWEEPKVLVAQQYADYVQPRKGGKGGRLYSTFNTTTGRHCFLGGCGEQWDAFEEGQISEFSIYGSGITNYFKFLKWCAWTFLILAVVTLPSLVLNIYGPNNSNTGLKELAKTTAGNLYPVTNATATDLHVPGCYGYEIYHINCSLDRYRLAQFYAYLDIAVSIVIFASLMWLRYFERVEDEELNKNTVNASMFTVMMSHIPPTLTEDELVKHWERLLPLERKQCESEGLSLVSCISIAYDNADEIRECTRRGDLIRSKVTLVHEHRKKCTVVKKTKKPEDALEICDKERLKFFEQMKKINEHLRKKEAQLEDLAKKPPKALFAFVTFDKVACKTAALSTYNKRSLYQRMFPDPVLKLSGMLPRVYEAPEPSTIIWENLHHRLGDRLCRRLFTTVASLFLVAISLVIIFGAKYLQETSFDNGAKETLCDENFTEQSEQYQINYIKNNPTYTHCYCDQFSTLEQSNNKYCKTYWRNNVNAQVLTYFASFIVLVVNSLIEQTMRYFSSFEKHHTEDSKGKSVFLRLFLLKYINTSTIFLIDNNNAILQLFNIQVSSALEFTADWFNTTGVTIILVQLGDIFFSHSDALYKYYIFVRSKQKAEADPAKILTQDELNKLYAGPDFEFAFNYAQLMSTMFVCLTFSTGIPVLYPIAAANYAFYYFVEKFFFVNLYRIPPHFNSLIGKRATSMVPIALFGHLCVAIWILSNDQLFSNPNYVSMEKVSSAFGKSIRDKISGQATFPLFIVMLVVGLVLFLTFFVKETMKSLYLVLLKCCGNCFAETEAERAANIKSLICYSRAIARNLIKGLKNYNILQNPMYKDAFAITWKFAAENTKVRDVRQMKTKAQVTAGEDDEAKIDALQRQKFVPQPNIKNNRGFSTSFYQPAVDTTQIEMVSRATHAHPHANSNNRRKK